MSGDSPTSRPRARSRSTGERTPALYVLSGPSGVGKDSILNALKERLNRVCFVVTATTRPPRAGETNGQHYWFVSAERFTQMQENGELLESAMVHGSLYGTPLDQVRAALSQGQDVVLKIDVQGAAQIKNRVPSAVFIFVAPPSLEELVGRLRARGTESGGDLAVRTADAYREMSQLRNYDYVVVNHTGRMAEAVASIEAIMQAESCRVRRRRLSV